MARFNSVMTQNTAAKETILKGVMKGMGVILKVGPLFQIRCVTEDEADAFQAVFDLLLPPPALSGSGSMGFSQR